MKSTTVSSSRVTPLEMNPLSSELSAYPPSVQEEAVSSALDAGTTTNVRNIVSSSSSYLPPPPSIHSIVTTGERTTGESQLKQGSTWSTTSRPPQGTGVTSGNILASVSAIYQARSTTTNHHHHQNTEAVRECIPISTLSSNAHRDSQLQRRDVQRNSTNPTLERMDVKAASAPRIIQHQQQEQQGTKKYHSATSDLLLSIRPNGANEDHARFSPNSTSSSNQKLLTGHERGEAAGRSTIITTGLASDTAGIKYTTTTNTNTTQMNCQTRGEKEKCCSSNPINSARRKTVWRLNPD